MSNTALLVEYFETVTDKVNEKIRLVVISDLHDHQFGTGNVRLIEQIEEQKPDLILMVGDMLNDDTDDCDDLVDLVEQLNKTAKVYYAMGNHEWDYADVHGMDFVSRLEETGANVMNGIYEDIEVNGNAIRIGALYEYAFITVDDKKEEYDGRQTSIFMEDFCDTDALKLFLTHRPEAFSYSVGEKGNNWDIDCVFSGHIHGGQIVIPGIGGLYGSELGWFPEYTDGKYNLNQTDFYVTRGLGSHFQLLPRMWNRPQIMVVDVHK